jgi:hypothetical protein
MRLIRGFSSAGKWGQGANLDKITPFHIRGTTALRAPPRIRQSRSCHRREQSFAHSGVRHALLPPAGDGALLHVGRSSSSSFLTQEELRARTIHAAGDKWADHGGSALPPTTDHGGSALPF